MDTLPLTLETYRDGPDRDRLFDFIRARFRECYQADVPDDSPLLAGAVGPDGRLVAAFGIRDATSGFFCETYLGEPIESLLGRHFTGPVRRHRIVEITHLCGAGTGSLRRLTALLPGTLMSRGYRFLTCTATACLTAYFTRRGLEPMTLGEACAESLPEAERLRWGSYYDAGPRVLAGDLREAARTLGLALPALENAEA